MPWRDVQLDYGIPATQIWHGQLALLALDAPCAMQMSPARHYEMPEYGEVADGTTWHSLIVMGCFLLPVLRKQIFGFFSTVRTHKDGKWVVFNVNWACR